MQEQTCRKTIVNNIMSMYIQKGVSMLVSLFTSRIIQQVHKVTDMGIQAIVGGVAIRLPILI